jgi:hypothetical protein
MIWHFGALGMNNSIYTCNNGTVNNETDPTTGDCKLDTKPQPQWNDGWLAVPQRAKIYNDWARMIDLKRNNAVFNGSYAISPNGSNVRQRIYLFDNSLSGLKNVVILANFSVGAQNITPDFPYTGTWVNLMDNTTTINVTNTAAQITIEPGGFRIYGNQQALSSEDFETAQNLVLYPNPATTFFSLENSFSSKVQIISITGQIVKTFESQTVNYHYPIADLKQGIYLVKVTDENNREKTMKLIKQ